MPVTPLGPAPHRRHGDVVAPLGCSPRVLARVPEIARDDPACTTLTRLLNTHTRTHTHTHTHPARPLRGVPTPPLCAGDTGPALKRKCARPRKEVRAARVGATGAGLRRRRGPRRSTPRSGRRRCSVVAVAGRVGRWRSLTAASPLTCCLSASASASASLSPPSPLPHRAAPSPLQAALEQASLSLTSTVDLGEEYGLRHRPWATLLPPCWLVTTGSLTSHHAG